MKRDMDLIRDILLAVEANPKFDGTTQSYDASLGISDRAPAEIAYDLVLLVEAGFLDGNTKLASFGNVVIFRLTWSGHEFLDAIRDPDIWQKTKERAKGITSIGIGFVWELAKAEIKLKLGLA